LIFLSSQLYREMSHPSFSAAVCVAVCVGGAVFVAVCCSSMDLPYGSFSVACCAVCVAVRVACVVLCSVCCSACCSACCRVCCCVVQCVAVCCSCMNILYRETHIVNLAAG